MNDEVETISGHYRRQAMPRPSRSFIELTRNIELAEQAPRRFEATVKGPHDVVI
jgi:hypothetical protein